MSKVVHFEIPADDPERAMAFYRKAFNWEFQKYDGPMPYWLVVAGGKDEPGIDGGLMPRENPGQGPTSVIGVESVSKAMAAVEAAGGKTVAPKMAIPGFGYAAYFTDPEGNVVGVFEPNPDAK